jgi:hypothetical protein
MVNKKLNIVRYLCLTLTAVSLGYVGGHFFISANTSDSGAKNAKALITEEGTGPTTHSDIDSTNSKESPNQHPLISGEVHLNVLQEALGINEQSDFLKLLSMLPKNIDNDKDAIHQRVLLLSWVLKDPERALQWVHDNIEHYDYARVDIAFAIGEIATHDVKKAMIALQDIVEDELRLSLAEVYLTPLFKSHPDFAKQWVLDYGNESMRQGIEENIIRSDALNKPQLLVENIISGATKITEGQENIIGYELSQSLPIPEDYSERIDNLNNLKSYPESLQRNVSYSYVYRVAEEHYADVKEWVKTIPDGELKDEAVSALVAVSSPATNRNTLSDNFALAMNIGNPDAKQRMLKMVVDTWVYNESNVKNQRVDIAKNEIIAELESLNLGEGELKNNLLRVIGREI